MIDFKTLPSRPINNGIQYFFNAGNGYGASIVQHSFSYGKDKGLWELAVVNDIRADFEFEICYTTPITDDVLGYLTEKDVNETLEKIKALPA